MNPMHESKEELKRADHLLYVSLKYTRTVDVIKSIIERLISGLDIAISCLLQNAKEKKLIKEIPPQAGLRVEILRKTYKDIRIDEMLEFYTLLRKVSRAEYKRSHEFRRHVTMTATTDTGLVIINLDVIKEYYERTNGFIDYIDNLLNPRKENENG
ncbi:hypothetical protein HYY72_03680 [Candidatus Woesearchaeota archaeon]|nr:hypothetical protein [Candidatus Woesearchaeota archaeon]